MCMYRVVDDPIVPTSPFIRFDFYFHNKIACHPHSMFNCEAEHSNRMRTFSSAQFCASVRPSVEQAACLPCRELQGRQANRTFCISLSVGCNGCSTRQYNTRHWAHAYPISTLAFLFLYLLKFAIKCAYGDYGLVVCIVVVGGAGSFVFAVSFSHFYCCLCFWCQYCF